MGGGVDRGVAYAVPHTLHARAVCVMVREFVSTCGSAGLGERHSEDFVIRLTAGFWTRALAPATLCDEAWWEGGLLIVGRGWTSCAPDRGW